MLRQENAGRDARSLNLANAASIALYAADRQAAREVSTSKSHHLGPAVFSVALEVETDVVAIADLGLETAREFQPIRVKGIPFELGLLLVGIPILVPGLPRLDVGREFVADSELLLGFRIASGDSHEPCSCSRLRYFLHRHRRQFPAPRPAEVGHERKPRFSVVRGA